MRDIRRDFVEAHQSGLYSVTELSERFGVSRQTAYKWIQRFREEGYPGLRDRRRTPCSSPNATAQELVDAIIELRDQHPTWGARKLKDVLLRRDPACAWPAKSTFHDILDRAGRVRKRKRRNKHAHPGKPIVDMDEPNAVWTADYKGQFRLGNGKLCYPLTVADGCSRYLLECRSLASTKQVDARKAFKRLFEEHGLPRAILTDNGAPFASTGLCGLSRLNAWWIRLGIRPVRTQPASPQQNGRHERMHRTLKAEATKPPAKNHGRQQRIFDRFKTVYNRDRPHGALGMKRPAEVYVSSPRPLPGRLPPIEYPATAEVRLVSSAGGIRWRSQQVFVSQAISGGPVGLVEVGDGVWSVLYSDVEIGRLDERVGKIR